MIPMDTLKEKNNWLIASREICKNRVTVSPFTSGVRYTFRPCRPVLTVPSSNGCFNVREKMAIPMTISKRTGMINLDTRSIPFSTPLYTISAVIIIKMRPNHTEDGEEIKFVKQLFSTAAFPEPVR